VGKNHKGFSVVEGLLILVILGMLGGVGYYVYEAQKDSDKSLSSASQTELQAPTEKTTTTTETQTQPKAVFTGTSFTQNEEDELTKKLVEPYYAYNDQDKTIKIQDKGKEGYRKITSFSIEKYSDAEYSAQPSYAKFGYGIDVMQEGDVKTGFLFAENRKIDWWIPECGFNGEYECVYSEEFKSKYPEIVKQTQQP